MPSDVLLAFISRYKGVALSMNSQEVCSTLHGIAKMNAKWDTLPKDLKDSILLRYFTDRYCSLQIILNQISCNCNIA